MMALKCLNKIAIGTAQFGMEYGIRNNSGKPDLAQVSKIIESCRRYDIDTLDTASNYGNSEKILGKVGVSDFKIVTKIQGFGNDIHNINNEIEKKIQQSLINLKVDKLHAVLLHDISELSKPHGNLVAQKLNNLKRQKIIKKLGVSVYTPADLDMVLKILDVDIVQAPLNLFDQNIISSGYAARLNSRNIELHTRSAFLQGMLLCPVNELPKQFLQWKEVWINYERELKENNLSPLKACLDYCLNQNFVNRVVLGVDSINQLEEIIKTVMQPNIVLDWSKFFQADKVLTNPSKWKKS
jgi:aryl-alcohol dehydrogenase-like predicted oxidoreductase